MAESTAEHATFNHINISKAFAGLASTFLSKGQIFINFLLIIQKGLLRNPPNCIIFKICFLIILHQLKIDMERFYNNSELSNILVMIYF